MKLQVIVLISKRQNWKTGRSLIVSWKPIFLTAATTEIWVALKRIKLLAET